MILLANMLILAHAVVPHHHHNKVFVAIVNVLDDDARDLFNHEHGHEHHHDGHSDHHNAPAHHHHGDGEDCLMSEAEAAAALKIQTDDSGGFMNYHLHQNIAKITSGDGHTSPAGIRIS